MTDDGVKCELTYLPLPRRSDFRQQFLRFSCLPLSIVQAGACLADVQLVQARLSFLDASDREVQTLTRVPQKTELRIFRRRCKSNRAHSRNLAARFSLGNHLITKNVRKCDALVLAACFG